MAIRVESLMNTAAFGVDVQAMVDYIKSSKPDEGSQGVLIPGDLERRTAKERRVEGIPIDDEIWKNIVNAAKSFGLDPSTMTPS